MADAQERKRHRLVRVMLEVRRMGGTKVGVGNQS